MTEDYQQVLLEWAVSEYNHRCPAWYVLNDDLSPLSQEQAERLHRVACDLDLALPSACRRWMESNQ